MSCHAHVVGSMLRRAELLEAHAQRASGGVSPAEFARIEDRAVDAAIAAQEAAGIELLPTANSAGSTSWIPSLERSTV